METFKCTECGYAFEEPEQYSKFTSYWGEEGWEDCLCPICDHAFKVKENVTREWEVKELGDKIENAEQV